jgi:hypothetical protein
MEDDIENTFVLSVKADAAWLAVVWGTEGACRAAHHGTDGKSTWQRTSACVRAI